jgi:hypothetical protein
MYLNNCSLQGYGQSYDDYYMADDGYKVSACVQGTDCTDCGGVDAIIDYTKIPDPASGVETCTNTCAYARDGVCDDPRGANYCKLGEDCEDCGPVGADNFTRADDDGWWDDDDDYWTFNDGSFLDQNKGLDHNRDRVKVFNKSDNAGPAAMFLVVLEGMVYTVGAIFAAAALYLGMESSCLWCILCQIYSLLLQISQLYYLFYISRYALVQGTKCPIHERLQP